MKLYGGGSGPETGLEESMWRLGFGGGGDGQYPERPGEPDCAYYMRTGACSYGEKCRYNHPRHRRSLTGAGRTGAVEYPERVGQPVCEHYMRTGNCKFGSTCKFHHPRQEGSSTVSLNYSGYPLRPGEKECAFYIKTGLCKFGPTCKFHHPQLAGPSVPSPAPTFYPLVQQLSVPSHQYPPYVNWQVARPSVLPGSYMPVSYPPMISPGVVPVQGWNTYAAIQAHMNPVATSSGQQSIQVGQIQGLPNQVSFTEATASGPQISSSSAGPPSAGQREIKYPERPGQPECQFYLRTGDCKFGAMCKYHHPPDWNMPRTSVILNALGLPLRPGAQTCTYYMQHGSCKFGQTCKYDHPFLTMSYNSSMSSLSDLPPASYPTGFPVAAFAPSSARELQPEFISSQEHFSLRKPSEN
ncbi:zinc finger CCCH domain-containing protein 5-like isoform X1 [Zingiber officinale]|uniref:zinc finger CCCH domain-containing protein 5-like isoform X1 n=1 Tax=Zingiber officinale TaxID=94328 RepID=UPI001C4ADCFE|nr:zinc finger CCCH domain-containing protein 5-like isoform X1 [Zingiber officinale]